MQRPMLSLVAKQFQSDVSYLMLVLFEKTVARSLFLLEPWLAVRHRRAAFGLGEATAPGRQ